MPQSNAITETIRGTVGRPPRGSGKVPFDKVRLTGASEPQRSHMIPEASMEKFGDLFDQIGKAELPGGERPFDPADYLDNGQTRPSRNLDAAGKVLVESSQHIGSHPAISRAVDRRVDEVGLQLHRKAPAALIGFIPGAIALVSLSRRHRPRFGRRGYGSLAGGRAVKSERVEGLCRLARYASTWARAAGGVIALSGAASCVGDRYAGVDLRADGAPIEVQALARKARDGDKQAQFALGERYERGDGLVRDRGRALALYRAAATDSGGTRIMLVPQGSAAMSAIPVSNGPLVSGLPAAKTRVRDVAVRSASTHDWLSEQHDGRARARKNVATDQPAFLLSWFEGRAPNAEGISRCEIGRAVVTRKCLPAMRLRTSFTPMEALYTSRSVAGLDGELSCHGVVCSAEGGARVIIQTTTTDCVNSKMAALSSASKYLIVRLFCKTPSSKILSTDFIEKSALDSGQFRTDQLIGILERKMK